MSYPAHFISNKRLEYAKKMTQKEVDEFYNSLRRMQEKKMELAQLTLEQMAAKLINSYHEVAYELENKYKDECEWYKKATECFDEKKCLCGIPLKEFKNRETGQIFLGCPDYLNNSVKHKSFPNKPYFNIQATFQNWLTKIIYAHNIKGKVHSKALLLFYEQNGLPDLMEKHAGISSRILIDRYTNIKKFSTEFEHQQVEILRAKLPTVIYQFPVKYKHEGEKEKYAFIDILCSNDEKICIYECKTNEYNIDQDQMSLYVQLIRYINNSLKINKHLTIDYLIQN